MTTTFPNRPIRFIAAASQGSAADIVCRALVAAVSARLRQPVTLELHPGENGVLGARLVASSPADGYTLLMTSLSHHAIAPTLHSLPYDVVRDFSPISLLTRCPLLLAVHPSVAAHSLHELTLLARQRPGALTFASSEIGGSPHVAAELYQKMAGVEMKHVCYERTQQLIADLIGGRISLSFNNIMALLEPVSAGKLRGLGVTSATRSPVVPQLPTLAEAGLAGYEITNWQGVVAPGGVATEIIAALNEAFVAAVQSESVKEDLAASGMEAVGSSPSDFARYIQSELSKWTPIVKDFMRSTASRAAPHS